MEFIIIALIIIAFASSYLEDKKKEKIKEFDVKTTYPTEAKKYESYTPTVDAPIVEEDEKPTVVNNYYTQNNVYVQQNNYRNKSTNESKGHSAKVWKRMGYKVRYGETYSYKFYGNEIFTPDQVERIGSNQVKYSESGLARKLLRDTGSKKHAKDILVDRYGYTQASAKSLVGYNGY